METQTQEGPFLRLSGERRFLLGFDNTVELHVEAADGQPQGLADARLSAALASSGGRRIARGTVALLDEPGRLLVSFAAPDLRAVAGQSARLGIRLDFGAGIVYEVQAPACGVVSVPDPPEPARPFTVRPPLAVTLPRR